MIISSAPFAAGQDSPLWSDAKAKIAKLSANKKISQPEAAILLADSRASLLALKVAYERVIAWGDSELPTAPSGRVGAITLPGGSAWYAAALKLNTTTDLTAEQIHKIGLREVIRIEGEQDAFAHKSGLKDRNAFYAYRTRRFPPQPWTDALRADYLRRANEIVAHNQTLLPQRFSNLPAYAAEVVREPSFSEVAGGAALNPGGNRPGLLYVQLLGTTGDPAVLTDLMCHEGIPGHVMAGDVHIWQIGTPKFLCQGSACRLPEPKMARPARWGLLAQC